MMMPFATGDESTEPREEISITIPILARTKMGMIRNEVQGCMRSINLLIGSFFPKGIIHASPTAPMVEAMRIGLMPPE